MYFLLENVNFYRHVSLLEGNDPFVSCFFGHTLESETFWETYFVGMRSLPSSGIKEEFIGISWNRDSSIREMHGMQIFSDFERFPFINALFRVGVI